MPQLQGHWVMTVHGEGRVEDVLWCAADQFWYARVRIGLGREATVYDVRIDQLEQVI